MLSLTPTSSSGTSSPEGAVSVSSDPDTAATVPPALDTSRLNSARVDGPPMSPTRKPVRW